mmetsp:Transcript_30867/g.50995  ORF Transcript_30867/g.50995 Transcript_30867/m.50995 type:complete len:453 (+) Transcript_30867:275-1633(+)|eukprot:CAMPEP_0119018950 /NCGR_PEP_ID=MMETSP1176-20130426/20664_1 /TAXON_ID=265551 /ORGANISM="Synedropsis recta cf, Strain CCMP1620" /LENGTH=452 /DNA_ID=CAMNT_0006973065 /DNA_START=187 /DNA_END=1545 /DNA_ORIENTATION=-
MNLHASALSTLLLWSALFESPYMLAGAFSYTTTTASSSVSASAFTSSSFRTSSTSSSSSLSMKLPGGKSSGSDYKNNEPLITSRQPHKLKNGRGTFLGFTNTKDLPKVSSSTLSAGALMPDGGMSPCVIRVLGVGGGGCNAVDRMLETQIGGVEYWAINTDAQALGRSKALGASVLNIGASVTRGLGAGGDPEVGRLAAEESRDDIFTMIQGTDLCFVTSGMGGGTGSGAAPVVSEIAKESGALTVAIVTKPFAFEGRRRMRQAVDSIARLRQHVDTVIVVSNNKLLEIIPDDTPVTAAFRVADDILRQGVVGISEIIVRPGLINVDFADVRSVMKDAGTALMGIGTGSGKTSAEDAAINAISSPLLDEPVQDATGVVFNILGPRNLSLQEVNRAARVIYENVHEDANVIFGALVDDDIQDEVSITVLATGFSQEPGGRSASNDVPDFLGGR